MMEKHGARGVTGILIGPFPPPIGGDTVMTSKLIGSRYWGERGIRLERVDVSPRAGLRIPDERVSWRDVLRAARVLYQFLTRLPRVDFVLLWSNSRFIVTLGLPIVLASKGSRKPVFVKPFGSQIGQRIERLPVPWRTIVSWALRKATRILPETRSLSLELVERHGFPKERVLRLPSFLPDSALSGAFSPKGFSGKCVFVGQVKREKGVFDIIDALRGRSGLGCDFFGPILERDREAFLAEIAKSPNVTYRGALEPAQVGETIRKYDALLLPTFHTGEGYPAVILEAFACGIPVVASRWRSIPEIVEEGATGLLVPPQSPHRIREALDRLSGDPRLYESLCRSAFDHARSFSEKAIVEGILIPAVMESLAPARRGAVSARPGGGERVHR